MPVALLIQIFNEPFEGRSGLQIFPFLVLQFLWAEFVNKYIYRGDILCYTDCNFGSGFVRTPYWEYAGKSKVPLLFIPPPYELVLVDLVILSRDCLLTA